MDEKKYSFNNCVVNIDCDCCETKCENDKKLVVVKEGSFLVFKKPGNLTNCIEPGDMVEFRLDDSIIKAIFEPVDGSDDIYDFDNNYSILEKTVKQ